jgi:hypothetical protein
VVGKRTSLSMPTSPAHILRGRHALHGSVTARTGWSRQNPYDPTLRRAADLELWCRTCTTSVWGHIPELLFFYRQGDVNVRNYGWGGSVGGYKLLRRYGPSSLGLVSTAYRMSLLPLKILAYRVFGFVNAQSILAHWYSERLLPHESLSASQIIRDILRTPLPGLPSPREEGSAVLMIGAGDPEKQASMAPSVGETIRP